MTPTNTTTPRGCRAGRRSRRGRGAALRPVAPLTARDPAARQRERGVRDLIQLQGLARSTVRAHLARPRAGGVPADGPGLDLRAHVRSSFLDVLTVPPHRPGDQRVTREEATVGYGWGPAARRCRAAPPAPAGKTDARLASAPRPRGEGSHRTVRGPRAAVGRKGVMVDCQESGWRTTRACVPAATSLTPRRSPAPEADSAGMQGADV